jgi:glutamyl/glutaminyl-tRNA synthetase
MEQQSNIRTTLDKISLIYHLPIEFSIDSRRPIKFTCPTIEQTLSNVDFPNFMGVLSLTPEKVKESNIQLNFAAKNRGDILQGFIYLDPKDSVLKKYLIKYIEGAEFINKELFVGGEKVMSYELQYIADSMLMSLGQEEYIDKKEKTKEDTNPIMAKILKQQKEAEEKLKKAKASKDDKLSIEEIILAVSYEFHIDYQKILQMSYYGLIWYFGYVGKVDAHKLNQMILSSGMSKQKTYSYWLNK